MPLVYLDEERSFGGSLDQAERRLAYYREVLEREIASFHLPSVSPKNIHGEAASLCGMAK